MLSALGYESMDAFVGATVPAKIRVASTSVSNNTIAPLSESELYRRAKELAGANKPFKSYIGMGYHNAVVPPVILRNVTLFHLALFIDTQLSTYSRSWKAPLGIPRILHTSLRYHKVRVSPRLTPTFVAHVGFKGVSSPL